ncbi:endoplasmic reticulum junction formation protein lunapark-B isoform X1 [Drosophila miranda]|uniref:endoplasmic reticulum junction formation protein lunapark-B isoform X1 n=1 Tax=Drosophila miranda TaxID=7229 RepID=UPI0007E5C6EC|nr:endoplasmic reticulum junction formation protein lunapark-B isoform X1 [Drosophila miranda]
MGFVLSKFRKEKSTEEVLEALQVQIKDLEKYMINTQERKRSFVTNFLGITIGAYIVGFGLWCCFYFPPTWKERIVYLVPLLLFPVIIVFMRQMFTWYFQRKLNKNGDKLAQLKEKKKKILEQVMDKETYKVAVNLLERFGDRKLNQSFSRSTAMQPQQTPQPAARLPGASTQQRLLTPYSSVYRNVNNNNLNSSTQSMTSASPNVGAVQELRRRTPFPVVDQNRSRSAVDRIVDFIVGDTPIRYGMICKECDGHNGMLPEDEYVFTSFRCAFCNALNPARKKRPVAPRLSLNQQTPPSNNRIDSSGSDSSDDYDSDKEQLSCRVLLQDEPSDDIDKEDVEANPNVQSAATVTEIGAMETETTEAVAEEAAGVVEVDSKAEAEEAAGAGDSKAEEASSS